jgi:hypothetical protein
VIVVIVVLDGGKNMVMEVTRRALDVIHMLVRVATVFAMILGVTVALIGGVTMSMTVMVKTVLVVA